MVLHNFIVGEGPIEVGVSHGDLVVAEVNEAITAEVIDPDDIIAMERARRPVRRIGTFSGGFVNETLNDGIPIRRALRFSVGNDNMLDIWFKNLGGAALTTGSRMEWHGTLYGRWQR